MENDPFYFERLMYSRRQKDSDEDIDTYLNERWLYCSPDEADREYCLFQRRKNVDYPQGRLYITSFLTECREELIPFKIKAIHDSHGWTLFYYYDN